MQQKLYSYQNLFTKTIIYKSVTSFFVKIQKTIPPDVFANDREALFQGKNHIVWYNYCQQTD